MGHYYNADLRLIYPLQDHTFREMSTEAIFSAVSDLKAVLDCFRWVNRSFIQFGPFYDLRYVGSLSLHAWRVGTIGAGGAAFDTGRCGSLLVWKCDTGLQILGSLNDQIGKFCNDDRRSTIAEIHRNFEIIEALRSENWKAEWPKEHWPENIKREAS